MMKDMVEFERDEPGRSMIFVFKLLSVVFGENTV